MRQAFADCIGQFIAVPVEGIESAEEYQRYVIEIDITPRATVCKEFIFEYCDSKGATQCYIREGSSNIRRDKYKDKKGNKTFEEVVNERAGWKAGTELTEKRDVLQKRVDQLEAKVRRHRGQNVQGAY